MEFCLSHIVQLHNKLAKSRLAANWHSVNNYLFFSISEMFVQFFRHNSASLVPRLSRLHRDVVLLRAIFSVYLFKFTLFSFPFSTAIIWHPFWIIILSVFSQVSTSFLLEFNIELVMLQGRNLFTNREDVISNNVSLAHISKTSNRTESICEGSILEQANWSHSCCPTSNSCFNWFLKSALKVLYGSK